MKPSQCGTASPPADGTRDREVVDRFADFLQARSAVAARVADGTYVKGQQVPAWQRYHLRLLAWRVGHL